MSPAGLTEREVSRDRHTPPGPAIAGSALGAVSIVPAPRVRVHAEAVPAHLAPMAVLVPLAPGLDAPPGVGVAGGASRAAGHPAPRDAGAPGAYGIRGRAVRVGSTPRGASAGPRVADPTRGAPGGHAPRDTGARVAHRVRGRAVLVSRAPAPPGVRLRGTPPALMVAHQPHTAARHPTARHAGGRDADRLRGRALGIGRARPTPGEAPAAHAVEATCRAAVAGQPAVEVTPPPLAVCPRGAIRVDRAQGELPLALPPTGDRWVRHGLPTAPGAARGSEERRDQGPAHDHGMAMEPWGERSSEQRGHHDKSPVKPGARYFRAAPLTSTGLRPPPRMAPTSSPERPPPRGRKAIGLGGPGTRCLTTPPGIHGA